MSENKKKKTDPPREFMILYSVTDKQIQTLKPMKQILNNMYVTKR